MGKIAETYDKLSGRIANSYQLWALLPTSLVAALMAWLSTTVQWINQFGPFGWASVGLISFVLLSIGLASLGTWREALANARAAREWNLRTDSINPLRDNFDRERIRVGDLTHPVKRSIAKKTFSNCQLVGPANVTFMRCNLNGVSFSDCDIVVAKDGAFVRNVIAFEDCAMIGGEIINATLFVPQALFDHMRASVPSIEAVTRHD